VKPGVLVIVGPTAAGKKTLAVEAAERFGGEIVSADSRKVYRLLDIGTAKPAPGLRALVPHHLVDVADPDEPFSAGEWVRLAAEAVRDIVSRGAVPIISGGTGFYIEAFREGLASGIHPDPEVRKRLEEELSRSGAEAMHDKLAAVDPARAAELHANDTVRVLRALEIYEAAGMTAGELRNRPRITGGDYDYFTIGVDMPRPLLYEKIDHRAEEMLSRGLLDELRRVLGRGYPRTLPSLDTVGYKEWFPLLDGGASYDECLDAMKRNTRRYAKRQLTWFRARKDIRWIDATDREAVGSMFAEAGGWLNERA